VSNKVVDEVFRVAQGIEEEDTATAPPEFSALLRSRIESAADRVQQLMTNLRARLAQQGVDEETLDQVFFDVRIEQRRIVNDLRRLSHGVRGVTLQYNTVSC